MHQSNYFQCFHAKLTYMDISPKLENTSSMLVVIRNADGMIFAMGTSQKPYLRLPWVWIQTFGPRELELWVWPEFYRTRTLGSQFDTSPSTEKLRPQSLKWTGFLVGESPDHVFWAWCGKGPRSFLTIKLDHFEGRFDKNTVGLKAPPSS